MSVWQVGGGSELDHGALVQLSTALSGPVLEGHVYSNPGVLDRLLTRLISKQIHEILGNLSVVRNNPTPSSSL